jgi:hypothetical protein
MYTDFFNLNSPAFWTIIEKFIINLVFLFLLIRFVYYRYSRKEIYVFSLFLMGIVIFFLGSMLPIVFVADLFGGQLGMAIGLFAIFTILRFRTRNLSVKDMAYFFTVIAISAVNSFEWKNFPLLGIFIFNLIIILSALVSEILLARIVTKATKATKGEKEKYSTHPIIYDNLEMLKPQHKEDLIKNVAEITGMDVRKVRIKKVDYNRKTAELDIYY